MKSCLLKVTFLTNTWPSVAFDLCFDDRAKRFCCWENCWGFGLFSVASQLQHEDNSCCLPSELVSQDSYLG